ncbi:MAG: hypothetical protein WCG78_05995, partial [Candidatus Omnitrophota bacterium]
RRTWWRGQNRINDGVLDYAEKYWWTYFGIGAGFNYRLFPRFSAGLEGELMYAPETLAWMRSDLYEGGTFELGMILGGEIKMPFKYYLLKNLSLDLTPYLTCWEINQSTVTRINGEDYIEPYSRTYIKGILAGMTLSF